MKQGLDGRTIHLFQAKHPIMPSTECWAPVNSVLAPCAKTVPDYWLNHWQVASGQLKLPQHIHLSHYPAPID